MLSIGTSSDTVTGHGHQWTSVRLSSPRQWESQTCALSMFTAAKSHLKLVWLTFHHSQKSPLLCLFNLVSLSGSLGFNYGGCSEVVTEVCMCTWRSVLTIRPRTGNLLPAVFPHPFLLSLIPKTCPMPEHTYFLALCPMFWKSQNCKTAKFRWKENGFLG